MLVRLAGHSTTLSAHQKAHELVSICAECKQVSSANISIPGFQSLQIYAQNHKPNRKKIKCIQQIKNVSARVGFYLGAHNCILIL